MKELDSDVIDGVLNQNDIESCYSLLGASCVEDLLQHDVARCLIDFKRAGIQTWMFTGDKGKTAKMIGIQCGLFTPQKVSAQKKDEEVVSEQAVYASIAQVSKREYASDEAAQDDIAAG